MAAFAFCANELSTIICSRKSILPRYLRSLNEDTEKLMTMNIARGPMGMLRSVDCMH